MLKSVCTVLILFSASICFSQNSVNQVKETTSASKSGAEENVNTSLEKNMKVPAKEEYVGTRPKSPNPDSLQVMPYSPSGEKPDKKPLSADKNTSKPH